MHFFKLKNKMSETTEQINYQDYVLKPGSDVLVPIGTYVAVNNLIQAVEKEHSKVYQTDKFAYYHRETHEKLSNKSKLKMDPEKLQKEYYQNIDVEATNKTRSVLRDDMGTAALRLIGEFRGVFRYNIQQGNGMLRSELEIPTVASPAPAEIGKANDS